MKDFERVFWEELKPVFEKHDTPEFAAGVLGVCVSLLYQGGASPAQIRFIFEGSLKLAVQGEQ